jgi:hypothetical protein
MRFEMDEKMMKKRIAAVAGKLKDRHLDGAVITNRANVSLVGPLFWVEEPGS